MVDWFIADYRGALGSATALDRRIQRDATNAGGAQYAAICALALRQAYGGTELVDYNGSPWAFLKEISSDGNVSTVDVVYPASPAHLYLSPSYLPVARAADPLRGERLDRAVRRTRPGIELSERLGRRDNGQDTQEDMPVEETGNMLIMSAAVMQRLPAADAEAFAKQHYAIFKQWADYLVPNTLDPGYQNQTDDFTGKIANSVNLAFKGIIGLGAMSLIAGRRQRPGPGLVPRLPRRLHQPVGQASEDPAPDLDLAYGDSGTWSLKYNCFPDRMLGLDLVPSDRTQEAAW